MSFQRVVTVTRLERLNNSVNGNPRYMVFTVEYPFDPYITSSDHGFVYSINNGWTRENSITGRKAWITLTRNGRINDLEYLEG